MARDGEADKAHPGGQDRAIDQRLVQPSTSPRPAGHTSTRHVAFIDNFLPGSAQPPLPLFHQSPRSLTSPKSPKYSPFSLLSHQNYFIYPWIYLVQNLFFVAEARVWIKTVSDVESAVLDAEWRTGGIEPMAAGL